jgi:hypothetical protein
MTEWRERSDTPEGQARKCPLHRFAVPLPRLWRGRNLRQWSVSGKVKLLWANPVQEARNSAISCGCKKTATRGCLPFDTPEPPPYIPAPRRPRGQQACGRRRFSGIMKVRAEGRLFDIVIRGRGTWAAARSRPVGENPRANQSSISERSRSSATDMNADGRRSSMGPEGASNSVMF